MANWVLSCPHCSYEFVHSKINTSTLADYYLPPKPPFPEEGQKLACTNCGKESTFQQQQLTYKAK
jgi:DNA-directed RNA polymerase subunit RPC12/RpoP